MTLTIASTLDEALTSIATVPDPSLAAPTSSLVPVKGNSTFLNHLLPSTGLQNSRQSTFVRMRSGSGRASPMLAS